MDPTKNATIIEKVDSGDSDNFWRNEDQLVIIYKGYIQWAHIVMTKQCHHV